MRTTHQDDTTPRQSRAQVHRKYRNSAFPVLIALSMCLLVLLIVPQGSSFQHESEDDEGFGVDGNLARYAENKRTLDEEAEFLLMTRQEALSIKVSSEIIRPIENCRRYAMKGDALVLNSRTYFVNGTKISNQLFVHVLGSKLERDPLFGLDEGLKGMCVNEERRIKLPAHLAYGERGLGDKIPPSTPIVLDCLLMSINYRDVGNEAQQVRDDDLASFSSSSSTLDSPERSTAEEVTGSGGPWWSSDENDEELVQSNDIAQ